jgi:hypothetical protein
LAVTLFVEHAGLFSRPSMVRAVVDAEGLVERATAGVELRRQGFSVDYTVTFADRQGSRYFLVLSQRLRGSTLRNVTEFVGTLYDEHHGAWGRARLRLDYRDVRGVFRFLGALSALVRASRGLEQEPPGTRLHSN